MQTIEDKEYKKFRDSGNDVKVAITGATTSKGLSTGGKITIVSINTSTWTALPASALSSRNAISIQNRTGEEIKINYSSSVSGYVGIVIDNQGERFYDITDDIIIYAKSSTSTVDLTVEEIA